jgi:hypothetical protein
VMMHRVPMRLLVVAHGIDWLVVGAPALRF